MARRSYSGIAPATSLTAGLASGDLVFTVASGTGYPTGAAGPFFVLLDRGLPSEEKVLVASRSGTSFTIGAGGRGQDSTIAAAHNSSASVEHTVTALDLDEANGHVNDTTGDPHPQYLTPTEGAAAYSATGHTHAGTKTVRIPHTFTISGDVLVAVGDTSFIPGFFIAAPAGQTVKVVAARHRINSGTSATVSLHVNGVAATGFSALSVTTATTTTDPTDVSLADGDLVALVVTAVSATPKNMSFTVWLESVV